MTTTSEQQAVPVAQGDRELFIFLLGFDAVKDEASFHRIHDGEFDGWEKMQRIARHRLARLTPIEGVAASELPVDVRALVIAAREFWDDNNDQSGESNALDKALEAFSSRVPYNDEPTPSPAIPEGTSGEGVGARKMIARIVYGWTPRIRTFEDAKSGELAEAYRHADEVIAALTPDATQTREAELVAALSGLELTEDGYSLRVAYDGDAADDGSAIVVGGETVVTFVDSDEGEVVREAILPFMAARAALSAGAAKGEAR